jgi:hypothetical protein
MVVWNARRALAATSSSVEWIEGRRKLPATYADVVAEIAKSASAIDFRVFAALNLADIDLLRAAPVLRELLATRELGENETVTIYELLAKASSKKGEWREAVLWVDRYLAAFDHKRFVPQLWQRLAKEGEGQSFGFQTSRGWAYDLRFTMALRLNDFIQARLTLENRLANCDFGVGDIDAIRRDLLRLAEAEATNNLRDDAKRIAGYVKRQALTIDRQNDMKKMLRTLGEVKEAATPWDSVSGRRETPPPAAPSTSST